MSNLKIIHPDIARRAIYVSTEHGYAEDVPHRNTIDGRRYNYAKLSAAQQSTWIDYDLGYGNSASVNTLAIARADLLQAKSVKRLTLDGNRHPRDLWNYVNATAWLDAAYDALFAPIAHYKCEDNAASTTVTDSIGNYNGTAARNTADFSTASGKTGRGFDFNGSSDTIDCGNQIIGAGDVTVCAWIKPDTWGGLNAGRIADNGKFIFTLSQAQTGLAVYSDGATGAYSAAGSITVGDGTWYHVVVTRTAAGITNFVINGAPSGTANQSSGTPAAGSTNLFLGPRTTITRYFDGPIDDVRIYNRILSASEIAAIYNSGNGVADSGLAAVRAPVYSIADQEGNIADLVQATASKRPYRADKADWDAMSEAELKEFVRATVPLSSLVDFSDDSYVVESSRAIGSVGDYMGKVLPYTQSTAASKPTRTRADNKENQLLNSSRIDLWPANGIASITASVANPLTGAIDAFLMIEDTSTGVHRPYMGTGWVFVGQDFRYSIYAKAKERTEIILRTATATTTQVTVDLNTGAISGLTGLSSSNVTTEPLSDGWWRITVEVTATGTNFLSYYIYPSVGGTNSYTGDGTSGLYIYGPQFQDAAADSDYLETTSFQEIRSPDGTHKAAWFGNGQGLITASKLQDVITASEGTYYVVAKGGGKISTNNELFGSGAGYMTMYEKPTGTVYFLAYEAGPTGRSVTRSTTAYETFIARFRHSDGNIYGQINGGDEESTGCGDIANLGNVLAIGAETNLSASYFYNGYICEIATAAVALNDYQTALLEYYFNRKWRGITGTAQDAAMNGRPSIYFGSSWGDSHALVGPAGTSLFSVSTKMAHVAFRADAVGAADQTIFANGALNGTLNVFLQATTGKLKILHYSTDWESIELDPAPISGATYIFELTQTDGTLTATLYDASGVYATGSVSVGDTGTLAATFWFGGHSGGDHLDGAIGAIRTWATYDETELQQSREHLLDWFVNESNVLTYEALDTEELIGPHSLDLITLPSESAEFRHWWLEYGVDPLLGTACAFPRSKEFFGSFFDIGRHPDFEFRRVDAGQESVEFSTGSILLGKSREPRWVFGLTWKLVTAAKAKEFDELFLQDSYYNRVWLYADGNEQILADMSAVYCRVLSDQCTIDFSNVDDNCTITAYFEQEVG